MTSFPKDHDTVLQAHGLGRRYGRRWALSGCTLAVPAGRVVGLVGPNGAGKTTLLRLAVGLLAPSTGTVEVLGAPPARSPAQLGRVGFVAQDAPVYANLTVADHLRLGRWLNPRWDQGLAEDRIARLGLDPRRRAGRLSGGQRAQLALTLAVAKRPDLLVLDEPVAGLDPLARNDFLHAVHDVAAQGVSVILSSHLLADLERLCDWVIVLVASRVAVTGTAQELLATHHRLAGPPAPDITCGQDVAGGHVVQAQHGDGRTRLLVRFPRPGEPIDDPAWTVEPVTLEDVVLAHLGAQVRS